MNKPSLTAIMPDSLAQDENFRAIAAAFDRQLILLDEEIKNVLHLPRLEELSGRVLDLLAWQFHVDNYTPLFLDDQTKRKLIYDSIKQHRLRGTVYAVENAVTKLTDGAAVLKEWFEYGGEPGWFRIELTAAALDDELYNALKKIVNLEKNVRSWCDTFAVIIDPSNIADIAIADLGLVIDSENKYFDADSSNIADIAIADLGLVIDSESKYKDADSSNIADLAIADLGLTSDSENKYFDADSSNIADLAIADLGLTSDSENKYFDADSSNIADIAIADLGLTSDSETKYLDADSSSVADLAIADLGLTSDSETKYLDADSSSVADLVIADLGLTSDSETKYKDADSSSVADLVIADLGLTSDSETKYKDADSSSVADLVIADLGLTSDSETKYLDADSSSVADLVIADLGLTSDSETKYLDADSSSVADLAIADLVIAGGDDKEFDLIDGDYLTLYFDYPTKQHWRSLTFPNPRADLTQADIKDVSDFITDKNLLLNKIGENPLGITRTELVKTVDDADNINKYMRSLAYLWRRK